MIEIRRALISCWDKTGLDELAGALHENGVKIISSGGTFKHLTASGFPVKAVEEVTGSPEVLEGRVKTLHPRIHAGILARRTPEHRSDLDMLGAVPIDLVVVNLYPFVEEALAKSRLVDQAIEFIDIGGPTLLRAAAKNHAYVVALYHPRQYSNFIKIIRENNGYVPTAYASQSAREIFFYTSWYDGQIQQYLAGVIGEDMLLPNYHSTHFQMVDTLRYGENPHQNAAVYQSYGQASQGLAGAAVLWGKPLSFNNYADIHAAYALVLELPDTACAIIKHTNPCGAAASSDNLLDAYTLALKGDPVSAFGGIVACNQPVDAVAAEAMHEIFFECIIAPDFSEAALDILKKKKNLRLLKMAPAVFSGDGRDTKHLNNTMLIQQADTGSSDPSAWETVTRKQPSAKELAALAFAWTICKHVKSNAIVLTRGREVYGVGAGQMSRIDSVRIASDKAQNAGRELSGLLLASDAFFPFRDGIDAAVAAGVTAVVQPGGSIRDAEVIQAADEHGISMVFTGKRHFKH